MFRGSKRLQRVHRLLDDELAARQRAAVEREIAVARALSTEYRKAEQVGRGLREAALVSLSDEEAAAFQRRLRERIQCMSPIRGPFSLLLTLWDAVSFPTWRLVVAVGMVAMAVVLFPVSRLVLQPEIGLGSSEFIGIETDIPDARVLILSDHENGSDRVWILAGDTS